MILKKTIGLLIFRMHGHIHLLGEALRMYRNVTRQYAYFQTKFRVWVRS
jgi:hypothetical protein